MSASEKLKALSDQWFRWEAFVAGEPMKPPADPPLGASAAADVLSALPQIVAVVEAAEKTYMTKDIHDSLAALDEALS